jgi:EAL domain-containing protein (putative c-di-GMP-specific phosphodiesterase class I)/ActR/RegA family two-component response regulator
MSAAYRILVIDDSPEYRVLFERMISKRCPDCKVELYDPVTKGMPNDSADWDDLDIVVLDYDLGAEDGLQWLQNFKKIPGFPPVLFLTGEGSERVAVKALKYGADDYLAKRDVKADMLFETIEEIVKESGIVPVGGQSKKLFISHVQQAHKKANESPASLLFVELDQASLVREAGGLVGLEEVMRDTEEITYRLSSQIAEDCEWVRFADAVVMCLIPSVTDDVVLKDLGNKIVSEIYDCEYKYSGQAIKTTASAGIVAIEDETDDLKTLLKKAEAASSAARIEGGNKAHVFPRHSHGESAAQADLARVVATEDVEGAAKKPAKKKLDIADAIKSERVILRFQPYVAIGSTEQAQSDYFYRALPYCIDKSGEEVEYARVLDAAYESGELIDLDLYVCRLILTDSVHFTKKYHDRRPGLFIDLATRNDDRLEFFTRITSMAEKVSNKNLAHPLILKISYDDFHAQSKEAVKAFIALQHQAGVRFCLTGVDSVGALIKSLRFNIFSYIEFGGDAAKGVFGDATARELVNELTAMISKSSASFIVSGIDSAEQLMNALIFSPDLACGEFIAEKLEEMIVADSVVTQIQL